MLSAAAVVLLVLWLAYPRKLMASCSPVCQAEGGVVMGWRHDEMYIFVLRQDEGTAESVL
jgi:hypothetical protein